MNGTLCTFISIARTAFAVLCLTPAIAFAQNDSDALDCLIEPWADVEVSAATEGLVEEVYVDRGDLVKKGQVIARLESGVERSVVNSTRARASSTGRIESSEARRDFARLELERRQSLGAENVVSASALDEARSAERVAEADLKVARNDRHIAQQDLARAEAALRRREIRSPVDGIVIERMREPGEYADPPQILRIAQIHPLRVEVFAPLNRIATIEIGGTGWVEPEAPIGGRLQAIVIAVSPVVDAASGTFEVSLELANPDHLIPAGLNCRVSIPSPDPD